MSMWCCMVSVSNLALVVAVLSVGEQGYWEGKSSHGQEGWFPSHYVQEVQMRNHQHRASYSHQGP